jgi:hypothetical protein
MVEDLLPRSSQNMLSLRYTSPLSLPILVYHRLMKGIVRSILPTRNAGRDRIVGESGCVVRLTTRYVLSVPVCAALVTTWIS